MSKALKTIGKIASVAAVVLAFVPGGQPFAAAASAIAGVANAGAQLLHQPEPQGGSVSKVVIDVSAPSPYVIGRTMTGGVLIHDAAYGAEYKDIPNPNRSMIFVYSDIGPVDEIEGLYTDFVFATSSGDVPGYYSGNMHFSKQLGSRPEFSALAGNQGSIPRWGSSYKLSGKAAGVITMRWDEKQKKFSAGVPELTAIVRGVKVYDPRLDDTYPGGSGPCRVNDEATFIYSENPALHALTYSYGRYENGRKVFGVGKSIHSIDVPAFVEWANVCDANLWMVGGIIYEPADRWNNLKLIMQTGSARPVHNNGVLSVYFDSPKVPVVTFTEDDLANGDVVVPATQSYRDRINGIIPRFRSSNHNWEFVPGTAVEVAQYVSEDGEEKRREVQYTLCQNEGHAAQLAGYEVVNARELKGIVLPLKPKALPYSSGEAVTLDMPNIGLSGTFIIQNRSFNPLTGIVEMTFQSETAGKHAFALGATTTPPATPALVFGEDLDLAQFNAGGFARTVESLIALSWPRDLTITANGAGEIVLTDHTRIYADETVSVLGATLGGNSFNTLYSIYYDDEDRDGGAVSYQITTDHNDAQANEFVKGRHFVGYITTPEDALSPDTIGQTGTPPTLVPGTVPNALSVGSIPAAQIAADIEALETAAEEVELNIMAADLAREQISDDLDYIYSSLPVTNVDLVFNSDQTEWTIGNRERSPDFINDNPPADLTYELDPVGGDQLISDGISRQIVTRKTVRYYQNDIRVYRLSGEFKVDRASTTANDERLRAVFVALDADYNDASPTGATVFSGYNINEDPDPVTGWTQFSVSYAASPDPVDGVDLYTGQNANFDATRAHHVRVAITTNYQNGDGSMRFRRFRLDDITDGFNAETNAAALIIAEESARVDGDLALADTINLLTSRVDGAESNIIDIQTTKADQTDLTAEAERIDGLLSRTDMTESSILSLQSTKADQTALNTEASRIDSLTSTVGGIGTDLDTAEGAIISLQTTKADLSALQAEASRIDTIDSRVGTAESSIIDLNSTKADQSALNTEATRIDNLTSSVGFIEGDIDAVESDILELGNTKADLSALTAEAVRIDALSASLGPTKLNLVFDIEQTTLFFANSREASPTSSPAFPGNVSIFDGDRGPEIVANGTEFFFTRYGEPFDRERPRILEVTAEFKIDSPSTSGGENLRVSAFGLKADYTDAVASGNRFVRTDANYSPNPDSDGWTRISYRVATGPDPVDGTDDYFGADVDYDPEVLSLIRFAFTILSQSGNGTARVRAVNVYDITDALNGQNAVEALVVSETSARVDADNALSNLITNLTSTVGDHTADISSNLGAIATANGAISTLQTDLNAAEATVSLNAMAVEEHDTLFAAGVALRVASGGSSAGLELYSLSDPTGSASVARISGDNILLDGTVGASKLNVNQLSVISEDIGVMRTASTGERLEFRSDRILVYDASNTLRVTIGKLT